MWWPTGCGQKWSSRDENVHVQDSKAGTAHSRLGRSCWLRWRRSVIWMQQWCVHRQSCCFTSWSTVLPSPAAIGEFRPFLGVFTPKLHHSTSENNYSKSSWNKNVFQHYFLTSSPNVRFTNLSPADRIEWKVPGVLHSLTLRCPHTEVLLLPQGGLSLTA